MNHRSRSATPSMSRRTLIRGAAVAAASTTGLAIASRAPADAILRPRRTPMRSAASSLTTGQYSIVSNPDLSATSKMGLVVLLPHEWPKIAVIKKANPQTKVYVYKNVGAVSTAGTGAFQPSVVTYQQVLANPGWRVHDRNNKAIMWTDFGGYLMPIDPGDAGLINTAIKQLVDECRNHGFDGVFLDDMNADWTHYNDGATAPVDFTGGSVFASTKRWVESVAPKLRQAGIQVVGNAQMNPNDWKGVLTTWADLLDGVNLEHFTRWGDYSSSKWPNFTGWMWEQRRQQAALLNAKGKSFLAISYGDSWDTTGARYHRANFLLMADRGFSIWCPSNLKGSWDSAHALTDVGNPVAAAEKLPNGLWKRPFDRGYVVVNPTGSTQNWSQKAIWVGTSTAPQSLASGDAVIATWG